MLLNSNTVIRQKAEDVSTAIFRGSSRTSRLHWIICFAICSQTGSWLKQADCSYSYQRGLFDHVWPVSLSPEDPGSIAHYKLPVWYPLCFLFFPDEFLFIYLSHTKLLHVHTGSACCFTQPDMLEHWPPAICSFVSIESVWIKQTFGTAEGKKIYI